MLGSQQDHYNLIDDTLSLIKPAMPQFSGVSAAGLGNTNMFSPTLILSVAIMPKLADTPLLVHATWNKLQHNNK